jgi:hypothetical protein
MRGMRVGPRTAGLFAGACGLALVLVTIWVLPADSRGWVGIPATIAVLVGLLGLVERALGALVPVGLGLVALGAMFAADSGRLPVPTAALMGLLGLAYLAFLELAETLMNDTGWERGGVGTSSASLAGWVRTLTPVFAVALVGVVVLSVVLLEPLPPAAALVVTAPVLLAVAVIVGLAHFTRRRPTDPPR